LDILKNQAKKFGIEISEEKLAKFNVYMNYLLEYNSHTNLTSITEPEDIMIKHFLDSILISKYVNIKEGGKLIDVGTGAGFPGLPFKIYNSGIKLTLIDSLNKRINFLKSLIVKLNLEAEIFHSRAEELSLNLNFREKFDLSVSRAVAPLNILVEYCLPYVKVGGDFIALKGPDISDELKKSLEAIRILGGRVKDVISFELPLSKGKRTLVIIEKENLTPRQYPRKNSKIAFCPL